MKLPQEKYKSQQSDFTNGMGDFNNLKQEVIIFVSNINDCPRTPFLGNSLLDAILVYQLLCV